MRVGRSAIDEDAIRLLEQHNPDVQFDWTHILKPAPQSPLPEGPKEPRERVFEQIQGRAQRRTERRAFPRPSEAKSVAVAPAPEPVRTETAAARPASGQLPQRFDEPASVIDVREEPPLAEESPLADEGFIGPDEAALVELGPEDRTSAAYQRLGSEGLARLRARHAEIMARIAERPMDDAAREELKMRAERLNPDGWVTLEEVQQALEQYETVFEGLRALVGTRRRRRRRRGQSGNRKREDRDLKPEA